MNNNEQLSAFRKQMADMFVAALKEEPEKVLMGWDFSGPDTPTNAFTNAKYRGVNLLYLKMIELEQGFDDSRWMTFKQIQTKGYHLQKGAKGAKIEYWMPYSFEERKALSWGEYKSRAAEPDFDERKYGIYPRYYTVFNAKFIEGLPELDLTPILHDIDESQIIMDIKDGMLVDIETELNSSRAYYSPSEDKIHLPDKSQFKSFAEYNRTALHELAHSTGHQYRLNRDQTGMFGTPSYAKEELVAEITSAFMSEFVPCPLTDELLKHHKGYVQNWAEAIENNENVLFEAIKEAEKAANYMIQYGGLEKYRILSKESEIASLLTDEQKNVPKKTKEQSKVKDQQLGNALTLGLEL